MARTAWYGIKSMKEKKRKKKEGSKEGGHFTQQRSKSEESTKEKKLGSSRIYPLNLRSKNKTNCACITL